MTLEKPAPKDADLANVEKALKRAAKTAHDLARRTHTPCYVVEHGKIVNVAESQSGYEAARRKSTSSSGEQESSQ